jgi:hypothetical protein
MMSLPSRVSDGIAEAKLAMARCRCRVMLMMALPSLIGDGVAEVMLAVARYR